MKHRLYWYVGTAVMAVVTLPLSAMAQAAPAYTNSPSEIYAGPDSSYPPVARVDGGVPVSVMGCVRGYSWCDIALPGLRGWIYGGSLNYDYDGAAVPLQEYGPQIGLPIIGFSVGNYWDNYYRGQPWYNDRGRWEHRGPPRGYGGPGPGGPGFGPHWDNRGGPPGGNFRGDQRFDRGPGGDHRGPGPGGGENRGPGGPGGDHRGPGPGGPGGGENHGGGPGPGGHGGGPGPGGGGPGGGHGGGPGPGGGGPGGGHGGGGPGGGPGGGRPDDHH